MWVLLLLKTIPKMWSSGTCVLTKNIFSRLPLLVAVYRLSLSGTVKGSLFCFLHFCWSQKITAGTRRTRFLSVTVFQHKKNFVLELFLLAGVGTGQSTETCTYLRRPIQRLRDWSGRIPVTVLVVPHQTKDPCKRENTLCYNKRANWRTVLAP